LVWWEGRTQADMKRHGKTISVWSDFCFYNQKLVLSIGIHATSDDELENSLTVEREKCARVYSRVQKESIDIEYLIRLTRDYFEVHWWSTQLHEAYHPHV